MLVLKAMKISLEDLSKDSDSVYSTDLGKKVDK
jgi:hypothetical protein